MTTIDRSTNQVIEDLAFDLYNAAHRVTIAEQRLSRAKADREEHGHHEKFGDFFDHSFGEASDEYQAALAWRAVLSQKVQKMVEES